MSMKRVSGWLAAVVCIQAASAQERCGYRWEQVADTGPSPRNAAAMACDEARGVTVLFGGYDGTNSLSDTWTWDGASWTQLAPGGPVPPVRNAAAMAYDPVRQVVWLFGGVTSAGRLNDIWSWDGSQWSNATPPEGDPAPSPRFYSGAVFDPALGELVIVGGTDNDAASDPTSNETWSWNGTRWAQRSSMASSNSRTNFGMTYDTHRMRAVAYAGYRYLQGNTFIVQLNTLEWNGAVQPDGSWSVRTQAGPGARDGMRLVYDPQTQRSIMFGGRRVIPPGTALQSDTWAWNGSSWSNISPSLPGPSARWNYAAAYDAARGEVVLFGGQDGTRRGDTWIFREAVALCDADHDCSGVVSVPDIFAFLSAWFAADSAADFNHDSNINVPDIFAFLSAWFAGC